ncbi:hypothetical protein GCM10011383_00360 [Hymenobacter cavernae]|uniref:Uncharacterized protein n=1 Tax=Hymenobacter cavernae TaxID=2044852 RepID=A0ABQ1TGU4_9BACT|nr:hypothetical protein GCM10011383_00360 [Hymenobacter cavernae]
MLITDLNTVLLDISDAAMVQVLFFLFSPLLIFLSLILFVRVALYKKRVQLGFGLLYLVNILILCERLILEPSSFKSIKNDFLPWILNMKEASMQGEYNPFVYSINIIIVGFIINILYIIYNKIYQNRQA